MNEQQRMNNIRMSRFEKAKGVYDENEDDHTDIVDMLADMQHWCGFYGVEFDEALATAMEHYNHEQTS